MRKYIVTALLFISLISHAQVSGSFIVNGDSDKFYPVRFLDGGWNTNAPTNLVLGRSSVHANSMWRGSLMASFTYHVTSWGNGSHFIDSDIKGQSPPNINFIAAWQDISSSSNEQYIIIWLRGGATTYYYQSNFDVNPAIYDGIQNILPYTIANGGNLTFKTNVEVYAATTGTYQNRNAYFEANVGIGTTNPTSKLTVAGDIVSREVKVTVDAGADFVFDETYNLASLESIDKYIKENKHLPEIASADEMKKDGINLSEMNIKLLQKIEEMTLYLIAQQKINNEQTAQIDSLKRENQTIILMSERITKLENKL